MRDLAIVTGTSSGLGKSVFDLLQAQEIACVSISRHLAVGDATRHIMADLAQPQDWDGLLGPILSHLEFSRIVFLDIAAVLPHGDMLAEEFPAHWDEAMRVNVTTPLAIAKSLAGFARGKGARLEVVHTSSGAAFQAIPRWAAYCASKAAAAMAWKVMESENDFVSARIFQPGVIATAMQAQLRALGDPIAPPEAALRAPEDVAIDMLRQCELVR